MRKTKIVATIGPASFKEDILKKIIISGMDVARINFSHGDTKQHKDIISKIRKLSRKLNRNIGILLDLPGPRIRVGEFKNGFLELKEGNRVVLVNKKKANKSDQIPVEIEEIYKILEKGNRVLLVDGKIELIVDKKEKEELICRVKRGGLIRNHQGVNLPDSEIPFPTITERDKQGIEFGFREDVDWIALSFVRFPDDLIQLKDLVATRGEYMGVIAKIERPEAVRNLKKIIEVADGVMVARGDLGVEIGVEEVPIIQKRIISLANKKGIPVITATQMLESMVENPFPTRAEVSDIANAIYDGSDALMLSEESASGKFPITAVEVMAKVINKIEKSIDYKARAQSKKMLTEPTSYDAIGHGVCQMACDLNAKAIIASTFSGFTAQMISKYRPPVPIYAITPNPLIRKRLSLLWGVEAFTIDLINNTDELLKKSIEVVKKVANLKKRDLVIVAAGSPPSKLTLPNLLKVEEIK
jgi:pyruvate kinase